MKKIVLVFLALASFVMPNPISAFTPETVIVNQNVTFRTTQHLKSNDGREIYLYTNKTCKLWDEGRLVAECNWYLEGGELHIYGGGVEYKASITWDSAHQNIKSMNLRGTYYYKA